jgi:hypothetical protein
MSSSATIVTVTSDASPSASPVVSCVATSTNYVKNGDWEQGYVEWAEQRGNLGIAVASDPPPHSGQLSLVGTGTSGSDNQSRSDITLQQTILALPIGTAVDIRLWVNFQAIATRCNVTITFDGVVLSIFQPTGLDWQQLSIAAPAVVRTGRPFFFIQTTCDAVIGQLFQIDDVSLIPVKGPADAPICGIPTTLPPLHSTEASTSSTSTSVESS